MQEIKKVEAEKEKIEVPVWMKMNLTIPEAAAYSNIGINRIDRMLQQPTCDFVLFVGRRKLVKREKFEQYIAKTLEI